MDEPRSDQTEIEEPHCFFPCILSSCHSGTFWGYAFHYFLFLSSQVLSILSTKLTFRRQLRACSTATSLRCMCISGLDSKRWNDLSHRIWVVRPSCYPSNQSKGLLDELPQLLLLKKKGMYWFPFGAITHHHNFSVL